MQRQSMLRSKALPILVLGAGLLAACASLGTPEDQSAAGTLWDEIADHRDWGFFANHVGIQEGESPHGDYIATYINSVTSSNQAAPPVGSILVKENYSDNDISTLDSYTVMKRVEGYDPDNGDWFWARYSADGKLTHSGKVAMCFDCHFDADGDDFVFLND